MKRTITTALALTLLCGTSAFAQERQPWARGAGGSFQGGQSREAAPARQEERRTPPAPAQQQQAQPQQERARPQAQQQPAQQQQAQQPQGQRPQGQRPQGQPPQQQQPQGQRPQGQAPQGQRPQGQQPQGGQQRPPAQNQARPDFAGRPDRPDSFVSRAAAEAAAQAAARARNDGPRGPGPDRDGRDRPGYNDGRGPGGYDRPGGPQSRPPVIRPEDRRDRDRNRPRYDQRTFPRYVTPSRRYQWRGAPWRPPVGFYSFRWQYGQILPWTWYTPNYYLNDYWNYGLPRPPIGCEWVRAGDDAILVDVFTGRVYQVVYNLFW